MGKTRASSSKRPHIDVSPQEEEENLSKLYKAKFLISSHEEGAKLTNIRFREIVPCKYIPNSLLTNLGMFDEFDLLLNQSGLKKFVSNYPKTILEIK